MTFQASENIPDLPFTFPAYEDWLEVARQELEGADPTKKLSVKKGDLEILPYYTASQTETKNKPLLKPSIQPYSGARSWVNTPKILVNDHSVANKKALSYLNSGAEGILFDCLSENINPSVLLDKISLPDCDVSFLLHQQNVKWMEDFHHYAENNFNKKEIKGRIFWPSTGCDANLVNSFADWPRFHSLGIIVNSGQNASDEIAETLKKAIELVEILAEKNISTQHVLEHISFLVYVHHDFFLEIARLKSLRSLWHQVRSAYNDTGSKSLHIHAQSAAWTKDAFQPHGTMITATTSAMAAIAGGCDSLTISPEDENNETMTRIAVNVSSILREESHFAKVADPTAGSYYLDALTNQLAEKAWSKFQSMVK